MKSVNVEQIKHRKHLDSLARLITREHSKKNKRDVCIAICHHDGKLFIASNKKKAEYPKECLLDLKDLLNNRTPRSCEGLLRKAAENIRYLEIKKVKTRDILKEFKEKAKECSESKRPDWSGLQSLAKKLFREIKEMKDSYIIYQTWKFLIPWHDVGYLVGLVLDNEIDDILKNSIKRKKKIVYVEEESAEVSNPNEGPVIHAEMKIVNKLYIKKSKNQVQEVRYIGCTKRACIHCQAVIDVINIDGKYYWENYGTHGNRPGDCKHPDIVTQFNKEEEVKNKIEEIKNRESPSINVSTSEVPEKLCNPVQLLDKLRMGNSGK